MSHTCHDLDAKTRHLVAELADALVPRTATMPSASDIGLMAGPLDLVFRSRPDLVPALERLPPLLSGEAASGYLLSLEREHTPEYEALLQAVLGAYYMHPGIKQRLGYYGQQAQSLPRGGFGGEELLEEMLAQPPRYRDPSSSK